MFNIHQDLSTRPTFLEIDRKAIRKNYLTVKKIISDKKILCIVKGNAYGHGAVEMAHVFQDLGADYLGVAIPEEGIQLRISGITIPILILSGISDAQVETCIKYDLTLSVASTERIELVDAIAKSQNKYAKVHIKIDTGMSRIGLHWSRTEKFIEPILATSNMVFEGIFSHLAKVNDCFTEEQIERFSAAIDSFSAAGINFDIKHIANSQGIVFHKNSHFSMVRAGMILYGYLDGHERILNEKLSTAMQWKTEITYFKFLEKGSGISYGHEYVCKSNTRLITLPVGYADGYQRSMGKKGYVLVNGNKHPIVGKVCMDQIMVDIGIDGEAYRGDEVVLVGSSQGNTILFSDIEKHSGLSVYEIMSQISHRVPRRYIH